jgi:hypothetical protein|tara:strand:- start:77 stop:388 length:312 start_codon:yes stop_codon:yes gene_type:complete
MKKIVFLISTLTILNGCAESTALLAPIYTMANSGSVLQTGNSIAMTYVSKKAINQSGGKSIINSLVDADIRECQTIHSAELNEIFFYTLDEIGCYKDPFSILR